jgi:dihydroxyacetone kinase-like protein
VVPDLPFKSGDEVALMVNGLGGTPIGELYVLYGAAHKKLEAQGIKVFRSYVNEYCTSLEMAGASLTLLKVNPELKGLLLEPAEVSIRVF